MQHPYARLTSIINKLGLSKAVLVNLALNCVLVFVLMVNFVSAKTSFSNISLSFPFDTTLCLYLLVILLPLNYEFIYIFC